MICHPTEQVAILDILCVPAVASRWVKAITGFAAGSAWVYKRMIVVTGGWITRHGQVKDLSSSAIRACLSRRECFTIFNPLSLSFEQLK